MHSRMEQQHGCGETELKSKTKQEYGGMEQQLMHGGTDGAATQIW